MNRKELEAYLQEKRELIDSVLNRLLPAEETTPSRLSRALRYSALAPGKRIRPILCLAACRAAGGEEERALSTAGSLEMIHTYSLIHDDLPSMDNDDLRRGRPTSHKIFGEGVAILAGDALLTLAFEVVAGDQKLSDHCRGQVLYELARSSGYRGLVGGQVVDLESEGTAPSPETLKYIHTHKTGALITAAVRCGALVAEASPETLKTLTDYGARIGLAFQIRDDILDIEGEKEKLGKSTGKDEKVDKATYPAVFGLEKSNQILQELTARALEALAPFGAEADPLREIARFIGEREK